MEPKSGNRTRRPEPRKRTAPGRGRQRSTAKRPDFKLLFQAAPAALVVLNPDLRIIAVSEAYSRSILSRQEDVIGKSIYEIFPDTAAASATWLQDLKTSLQRVLRERTADSMPVRKCVVRQPADEGVLLEERYWSARNAPMLADDGSVEWIIHQVEDVTRVLEEHALNGDLAQISSEAQDSQRGTRELLQEAVMARKQAERAREEVHLLYQRLHALLQAAPVGICFSDDPTCRHVTGNPALLSLFEVSPEDNVSASAVDPGAAGPQVRYFQQGLEISGDELPLQRAAAENAEIPPTEYDVVLPSGRRWTAEVFGAPIRDASGKVIASLAIVQDITARKQAEAQLQLLSTCIDRMNDMVLITEAEPIDLPGPRIVFVNNAFIERTGYSREEVVGKSPRILQGPKTSRAELDRVRCALKRWKPVRAEVINYTKSGEEFWVELDIVPVKDKKGWFTHWVAVQRDVTERKRAEEALRLSRERLAYVLDASSDGFWDWNVKTGEVYFSPQWIRLLGYSPAEVPPTIEFWKSILHPDDWAHTMAVVEAHFAGRTPGYYCENRLRMKSGEYRWNMDRGKVVEWDEDGTPLRMVGSDSDITERKKAELAILDRTERLRAILNTVADAVITIDRRGMITQVNPATEAMFGYSENELVGQNVTMLMPPADREQHRHSLERYRHPGETRLIGLDREVHGLRRDGTLFPIELAVSEVGDMPLFTGVIRDITQRKRLQAEVLRIAEEERSRVAADLHDGICQELVGIEFYVHLLRRELEKTRHSQRVQARRIEKAIRETTNHTRQVARGMNPVVADGHGLMHALKRLASTTSRVHHIRCIFQCPEPVWMDDSISANELYRIAQEAVRNAACHGHAKRITIRLAEQGRMISVAIIDNGSGLPEDFSHGTGMGVRVMRYRAGMIGGELTIHRRRKTGVQVVCRIPKPPTKK